jgi:hypothetical protein
MLAHDRTDTVELIDVHRFHQPWEKLASSTCATATPR